MKLEADPRLPVAGPTESQFIRDLVYRLNQIFRATSLQVNGISEGTQVAFYAALAAVPVTGKWAAGDFVLNSTPTVAGTAGSRYIIHGWRCVTGGEPGTWVQCRFLTGT